MKRYLAIGTVLALGALGAFVFHARGASPGRFPAFAPASSSSQIYIHGTPVCVFQAGGAIVARVGSCGDDPGKEDGAPGGDVPFSGTPSMKLPPGHPPVTPDMESDGPRRTPI